MDSCSWEERRRESLFSESWMSLNLKSSASVWFKLRYDNDLFLEIDTMPTTSETVQTYPTLTMGKPGWASVSFCNGGGPYPSIKVAHRDTLDEAEQAKRFIDEGACGARCQKRHRIYRVVRGRFPRKMLNPWTDNMEHVHTV